MNGKKTWRLSKTLSRAIEVRPIEQEDVKYAWAAYCKGSLSEMGAPFDKQGLDASQFKEAFEAYVLTNTQAAWTVIAKTARGMMPVGFVFGGWAPMQAYMIIIGITWFPWATKRNIVEGTVQFFNRIRKELPWMGFASGEHKRLYEVCMKHGIMRRIGTSERGSERIAVFEGTI
jgi:hypothetical protein